MINWQVKKSIDPLTATMLRLEEELKTEYEEHGHSISFYYLEMQLATIYDLIIRVHSEKEAA